MRSSTMTLLAGLIGGSLGVSMTAVPAVTRWVATHPAIVADVERACIPDQPPVWPGQAALFEAMRRVAPPGPRASMVGLLLEGREGNPGSARDFLARRQEAGATIWTHLPHLALPRGSGPVLAGEVPANIRWWGPGRSGRHPVALAWEVSDEVAALFLVGRADEGLRALQAAYRATAVLRRGRHGPGDYALVSGGVAATHHLDRAVYALLRAGLFRRDQLPTLSRTIVDDDGLVSPGTRFVDRDVEFRLRAVRWGRENLPLVASLEGILWGDGEHQVRVVANRWRTGWRLGREHYRGAHPVVALHLPPLRRLRSLELRARDTRDRLLDRLTLARLDAAS